MNVVVEDDFGRELCLPELPTRLVSLVPSVTETLFALGRGDLLAGVTRYCVEPRGRVERIERVGGTKNPDIDAIVRLKPDVVLINPEENRKVDFEALEKAGLRLFVTFPRRVQDVPRMLRQLAELSGAPHAASDMLNDLSNALAECASAERRPPLRVFCPIWKNPWMSFNHDTYADDMLRLGGGENVCSGRAERYPVVELDDLVRSDPEVVLLPDEPYVFSSKDLPALTPLAATSALRNDRVHFIDGRALHWYGPRSAGGLRLLTRLLA